MGEEYVSRFCNDAVKRNVVDSVVNKRTSAWAQYAGGARHQCVASGNTSPGDVPHLCPQNFHRCILFNHLRPVDVECIDTLFIKSDCQYTAVFLNMNITVNTALLITMLLIFVRLSALFLFSPLFLATQLPVHYRVFFSLALSLILLTSLPETVTIGELMRGAMSEAVVGALLAFGLYAAFAAFQFAGRIMDFQIGFGVADLIDPTTNTQAPLMGMVLNIMGVVTFFLLNGHHMLLRGLAYSLEKVPPGSGLQELNLSALVAQFGIMFTLGTALVAPVIISLLLLDIGMAIAARTMPQLNMFIVGIPLKIILGLVLLAVSFNYMGPLLEKIYASIFQYWERVLG